VTIISFLKEHIVFNFPELEYSRSKKSYKPTIITLEDLLNLEDLTDLELLKILILILVLSLEQAKPF